MLPDGWKKGTFQDGATLISGQHVEAKFVNSIGVGAAYLTGPADFPAGKIVVSKYTEKARAYSEAGDLLITVKGSGTGKIIESDRRYAISRQLMALRPTHFNSKFIYYSLIFSVQRYENAASGLIPGISREDVLKTPLLIPPHPEQKKIAQILSTWDKAITITEQLLANSQQQKKALMQQLLTGKRRFLGFDGAWENGYLSDVARISKGRALSSKNLTKGAYPVVAGGKTSPYQHGDFTHEHVITISASGAYAGYIAYHNYKIWASDCSVIEAKKDHDITFIYQYLCLSQKEIYSLQSGGAQPHIYPKDLESLKIKIPLNEEQQKISLALSIADLGIGGLQQKLDYLKQEKQALMQQLLTGIRRVEINKQEVA